MSKLSAKMARHKFFSAIIIVFILGAGYLGYKKIFSPSGAVSYATAQVKKGTLVVSVTGSGQVSVSDQIDVKTKAGGDIIAIPAIESERVTSGAELGELDSTDAEKSVRDAQINLDKAKLELQRLQGFSNDSEILRSEKQKAEDDLTKAYDDGFNSVSNAFLDLPTVMTGLYNILFANAFNSTQTNINYYYDNVKNYDIRASQYNNDAFNSYQTAKTAYDQTFADYKSATRFSDRPAIEALINETYDTTKIMAQAIKSANDFIQFYKDTFTNNNLKTNPIADTHLSSLNIYTGEANTHLVDLLSIKNTLQSDKEAIASSDLDVANQKILVEQAQNVLQDARDNLANYFVRAPFDGIVAKLDWKKGDTVSNGAVFATLIATQRLADITLNEVDVTNVKVGQKATLTFDAIPDLTIAGQVAEVDTIGTVSQGVVTYDVKIGFDTQDERVKPGMSVSAAIVTQTKSDVLLVPNSALKSQGGANYVEMPDAIDAQAASASPGGAVFKNSPVRQIVDIGIANDESSEVLNGLKEGDLVITRTIQPTSSAPATQTSQNSGLRIPGLTGGGMRGGGGNH